ncbi:MAG: hypothetical protein AB2A00_39245 [Myxococcota bacterium]
MRTRFHLAFHWALLCLVAACPSPQPGSSTDGGAGNTTPDATVPADGGTSDAGNRTDGGTDADAGHDDAGSGPDGGDAGPGPTVSAQERLGVYLPARHRSMLTSATSSLAIFGMQGVPASPSWFGLTEMDPVVSTGLVVLNQDTGVVRLYTAADGVPEMVYHDDIYTYGAAPVPFFDLTWIEEGVSFAGASWEHLVKGVIDANGNITFSSTTLRRDSSFTVDAKVTSVAVSDGELFVGSDQGVAALDPTTLEVLRWVELDPNVGAEWTYGMSAGTLAGPVISVVFGAPNEAPTRVALVRPGQATAEIHGVDNTTIVTTTLGMDGAILVGALNSDGTGRIHAILEAINGVEVTTWATQEELTTPMRGEVTPGKLAYDRTRELLLVGGVLEYGGTGGGLVAIPTSPNGVRNDVAQDLMDPRDLYRHAIPDQVDVLAVDAAGRWLVGGRKMCSESRLGVVGTVRIEQENGELRVSRPYVSGVRSVALGPQGETWLGLRDEIPGLVCEGITVQQEACRLKADGSCEIFTPRTTPTLDFMWPLVGPAEIAFGDATRQEFAVATVRDALFVREGQVTQVIQTQFDPGLSLYLTSAAYGEPGALWLGSEMHWEEYNDPELDEEAINDRGPHGLGLLEFSTEGRTTLSRRYVRKASDSLQIDEVPGLPSNHVHDVLPLPGRRHALAATGIERLSRTYDHELKAQSELNVHGGIAVINDDQVSTINPPDGITLGDVTDLALAPDGRIFALDAEAGVLLVDLEAGTSSVFAAASWTAPERGLALAVDDSGRVAVGTTHGLLVLSPSGVPTRVAENRVHGWVWTLRFMSDGVLYAGTDQGLLRVALDGAALPTTLGPSGPQPRDPWELGLGCNFELGCECAPEFPCASGLECACGLDGCVCQEPVTPCDGTAGCACTTSEECAGGFTCGAGNTCELDGCAATCGCTTLSGCPDGYACQSDPNGDTCVRENNDACLQDCSCDGPDGCPQGYHCQGGIVGFSCVAE